MKRLIKTALFRPEDAVVFEEDKGEARKHLAWEKAAERIVRNDPTGARSFELWYRLWKETEE
jgi:hypothetical protein